MTFRDRSQAGRELAQKLQEWLTDKTNVIILGLPRGGVIVAKEVAKALKKPLDILVVRKLGYPGNPELAMGAIGEEGNPIFHPDLSGGVDEVYKQEEIARQKEELARRLREYRGGRTLNLRGKTVIIIDDGIATGLTVEAAIESVKRLGAAKVIVATPVAAADTVTRLTPKVDDFVALFIPPIFYAVGQFYEEFPQTTDEEVKRSLRGQR